MVPADLQREIDQIIEGLSGLEKRRWRRHWDRFCHAAESRPRLWILAQQTVALLYEDEHGLTCDTTVEYNLEGPILDWLKKNWPSIIQALLMLASLFL